MIEFVVSSMSNAWRIAFLAILLFGQNALGYSTFDPDTTWHEGFGTRHALDLQEKVKTQDNLGSMVWCKQICSFVRISPKINDIACHLDITNR